MKNYLLPDTFQLLLQTENHDRTDLVGLKNDHSRVLALWASFAGSIELTILEVSEIYRGIHIIIISDATANSAMVTDLFQFNTLFLFHFYYFYLYLDFTCYSFFVPY